MAEETNSVTKADLVKRVVAKTKKNNKEVTEVIIATLDSVKEALASGEEVRLVNFGVFRPQERAARTGVNPKTRQKMQVPAKMRVKFTPGKVLNESVAHLLKKPAKSPAKAAGKK